MGRSTDMGIGEKELRGWLKEAEASGARVPIRIGPGVDAAEPEALAIRPSGGALRVFVVGLLSSLGQDAHFAGEHGAAALFWRAAKGVGRGVHRRLAPLDRGNWSEFALERKGVVWFLRGLAAQADEQTSRPRRRAIRHEAAEVLRDVAARATTGEVEAWVRGGCATVPEHTGRAFRLQTELREKAVMRGYVSETWGDCRCPTRGGGDGLCRDCCRWVVPGVEVGGDGEVDVKKRALAIFRRETVVDAAAEIARLTGVAVGSAEARKVADVFAEIAAVLRGGCQEGGS